MVGRSVNQKGFRHGQVYSLGGLLDAMGINGWETTVFFVGDTILCSVILVLIFEVFLLFLLSSHDRERRRIRFILYPKPGRLVGHSAEGACGYHAPKCDNQGC